MQAAWLSKDLAQYGNDARLPCWILPVIHRIPFANEPAVLTMSALFQASTDQLDLMGIATMLLNRGANCCPAQSGVYRNLRTLVRHRKKLFKMKTGVCNRIHTIVDRLFPGFLNKKKSGIVPFSNSSLQLMQMRFSAPQIRLRQRRVLIRNLEKRGTKKDEQVAAKLQEYASQVLTTPDGYTATLQVSLDSHVIHYRCLFDGAHQLVNEMAQLLAQTQGDHIKVLPKLSD